MRRGKMQTWRQPHAAETRQPCRDAEVHDDTNRWCRLSGAGLRSRERSGRHTWPTRGSGLRQVCLGWAGRADNGPRGSQASSGLPRPPRRPPKSLAAWPPDQPAPGPQPGPQPGPWPSRGVIAGGADRCGHRSQPPRHGDGNSSPYICDDDAKAQGPGEDGSARGAAQRAAVQPPHRTQHGTAQRTRPTG